MPKGKRKPQTGTRLPSLRGVVVVDEWLGQPRTRAWPRPRGENRHPTNIQWTEWLKGVTFLWRYQPANFREQLERATKNTPWMPRDPFISAARGRAWSFTDQNGRTWYPVPARQAVSQSLDAIAQLEGSMLYRGANGWLAVPAPSAPALVLTSSGITTVPTWEAGGGGGGSLSAWSPITPPETPGDLDDEFVNVGAGIPAGWDEWDFGAVLTPSVDLAGLKFEIVSGSSNRLCGGVKDLPSGDFTMWTRVNLGGRRTGSLWAGLLLLQDRTSSTGDCALLALRNGNLTNVEVRLDTYTAWNGATTNVSTLTMAQGGPTDLWLAISRSGSTFSWWYSYNGEGWSRGGTFTLAYTPAQVGLGFNDNNSLNTPTARFNFFRYLDFAMDTNTLLEGRRV
jgi:hypothetical protein